MESQRDLIYGINAVLEALKAGGKKRIKRIILSDKKKPSYIIKEIILLANHFEIPIEKRNRHAITKLTGTDKNQGIAGIINIQKSVNIEDFVSNIFHNQNKFPTLVIAEGIEDPGNLGALIRSAEVLGLDGVIIPKRRAVGITPTVGKASAGAIEHIPVISVTNIVNTIDYLKSKGFWVVGTESTAKKKCYDCDFLIPTVVVVGGEGKGIRSLVKKKCDFLISIPIKGTISSLNTSTAGAIIFYEILRQRNAN